MIGIYKITSPTGKVYIGSSKDIEKRIYHYIKLDCKGQKRLYNSLSKYGWDAHIFEIIEECSFEELYNREAYWGDYFNALGDNGLNCILPKIGEIKRGVSDETRKKMSEAHKGEKNHQYGKPLSEEHKEAVRKAQTGRKHTPEHRAKVSKNNARNNSKPVINLDTGEIYPSIRVAAEMNGYVHSTLKSMLNGSNPNKTNMRIIDQSNNQKYINLP